MWYGIGNTVIANPSSMQAGLRADGRVVLYNGAVDIGQGTYTILPQILADAIGVPLKGIDQVCADTDLTLDAGKSSASRQTFVSGNAARLAGEELRARILGMLGVAEPATLRIEGSIVSAASAHPARLADATTPEARIDLRTLPRDERGDVLTGTGYFDPPTIALDDDGQGVPYATYGFAAQFAEVEVDLALGTVRVLAIHAAHDVGRAINPTQVEGQIHGGIAQGVGQRLFVDQPAARRVDQKCAGLHQLQFARADQVAGLLGQRAMQCQRIDLRQQLLQIQASRTWRTPRQVAGQDVHAEGFGQARHGAAEFAVTKQAERLPLQLDDWEIQQTELPALLPAPAGDGGLVVRQAGSQSQQQHQRVLGHGRRAVRLAIADGDAAPARRFQVDVVGAGGGDQDQLEVGAAGERFVGQGELVDDRHLRTLQALDDLLRRALRVADQLVEGGPQRGEIEITLVKRGEIEENGAIKGHQLYLSKWHGLVENTARDE
jgi:hypothetical protein